MLVNISDAFPLDTLISRPQILKNPHDIYPDTGGVIRRVQIERDPPGSALEPVPVLLDHAIG